jgi:hypothetical protein
MRRNWIFGLSSLALVALTFTSCSKKEECIECDGEIIICEEEYKNSTAGATIPWSTYKTSATLTPGCKVVKK